MGHDYGSSSPNCQSLSLQQVDLGDSLQLMATGYKAGQFSLLFCKYLHNIFYCVLGPGKSEIFAVSSLTERVCHFRFKNQLGFLIDTA